jgi:hypothetical protein
MQTVYFSRLMRVYVGLIMLYSGVYLVQVSLFLIGKNRLFPATILNGCKRGQEPIISRHNPQWIETRQEPVISRNIPQGMETRQEKVISRKIPQWMETRQEPVISRQILDRSHLCSVCIPIA